MGPVLEMLTVVWVWCFCLGSYFSGSCSFSRGSVCPVEHFAFFLPREAQNAQQLHERIQSSSMDAKLEALKDLASLSRDVTFAQEFINLDGISLLTQMVESGTE